MKSIVSGDDSICVTSSSDVSEDAGDISDPVRFYLERIRHPVLTRQSEQLLFRMGEIGERKNV